jgi:hypothetical protein
MHSLTAVFPAPGAPVLVLACWALLMPTSLVRAQAVAPAEPARALIAVIGDVERFNVGQDGYCGARTEIPRPSNARFRIPAGRLTHLYIKGDFETPLGKVYCEGNFSFTPEADKLHIIRQTMYDKVCNIEFFKSTPGSTPEKASLTEEPTRSCLGS